MKNTARKASVQSSAFRRQHAFVHVSAIMHILPGYRGTYIRGRGGGMYFRGIAADSKFQSKMKGHLFLEGYLFTGFYGNLPGIRLISLGLENTGFIISLAILTSAAPR